LVLYICVNVPHNSLARLRYVKRSDKENSRNPIGAISLVEFSKVGGGINRPQERMVYSLRQPVCVILTAGCGAHSGVELSVLAACKRKQRGREIE